MIFKLGMKHQAMELYKVYINHDPGMTLTFLRQGQLRPPMDLNVKKNRKMSFNGKKLANGQKIYVYENILGPEGCLPRGNIHVYDHNIETSSLKPLG